MPALQSKEAPEGGKEEAKGGNQALDVVVELASKRTEINNRIIATLNNVPLAILHVDKQHSNDGLRQRALREDAQSAESILQRGYDPGMGTLVVIEVGYTPEEWKKVLQEAKLPEDTPQPPLLQTTIKRDKWGSLETIDYRTLEPPYNLRKFIMVDGNHRIWVLKRLKDGTLEWQCISESDKVVPETIGYIRLMYYDSSRPEDVLAASMYFNALSSKNELDTYIDRVTQCKALVKLYKMNLHAIVS